MLVVLVVWLMAAVSTFYPWNATTGVIPVGRNSSSCLLGIDRQNRLAVERHVIGNGRLCAHASPAVRVLDQRHCRSNIEVTTPRMTGATTQECFC